jgi:hypothetical protein
MSNLILGEWSRDWGEFGIEKAAEAIDDLVSRLKVNPITAELGERMGGYKDVIVRVLKDEHERHLNGLGHDEPPDYEEAQGTA